MWPSVEAISFSDMWLADVGNASVAGRGHARLFAMVGESISTIQKFRYSEFGRSPSSSSTSTRLSCPMLLGDAGAAWYVPADKFRVEK